MFLYTIFLLFEVTFPVANGVEIIKTHCPSNMMRVGNLCLPLKQFCDDEEDCIKRFSTGKFLNETVVIPKSQNCKLPSYPELGSYVMGGNPKALPGEEYPFVYLNITCRSGFMVEDEKISLYCYDGFWSNNMPKCIRTCNLQEHPSVQYQCINKDTTQGFKTCGSLVPTGTIVKPVCRVPIYYSPDTLDYMHCNDGNWTYVAKCKADCGKITPEGKGLIAGGKKAYKGELPWHAAIYTKTTDPYEQICGGSLIRPTIVISAAHCFWNERGKLAPTSEFAVAVGKIYRPWNSPQDLDAQKSDVAEIKITPYFKGASTNFQDDIALVIVATPFTYQAFVRPVCLDFDEAFEQEQLSNNKFGKVAGWGLVGKNSKPSQVLKVVDLAFINVEKCFAISPQSFTENITGDKICAGFMNGTALCQGDSGGGLSFRAKERNAERYYLRGVVSTAPKNEDLCNTKTFTTFTRILKHELFIQRYLDGASPALSFTPTNYNTYTSSQAATQESNCILPPYPVNGSYTVDDDDVVSPGETLANVIINVTCDPGFELEHKKNILRCGDGVWSDAMPKCIYLEKSEAVDPAYEENSSSNGRNNAYRLFESSKLFVPTKLVGCLLAQQERRRGRGRADIYFQRRMLKKALHKFTIIVLLVLGSLTLCPHN